MGGMKELRERLAHAQQTLSWSARRNAAFAAAEDKMSSPAPRSATEQALNAQNNQLLLLLEASAQRSQLLERRLLERQQWVSPRDVLELWEELERDVERLGVDRIDRSIKACRAKESEAYQRAMAERERNAVLQEELHAMCLERDDLIKQAAQLHTTTEHMESARKGLVQSVVQSSFQRSPEHLAGTVHPDREQRGQTPADDSEADDPNAFWGERVSINFDGALEHSALGRKRRPEALSSPAELTQDSAGASFSDCDTSRTDARAAAPGVHADRLAEVPSARQGSARQGAPKTIGWENGAGPHMPASSTDSLVAGQPWHLAGLPYAQAAAPSLRPAGMEGVLDVSPWPSSSQLGAPRGSPSASRASLAEAARVANAGTARSARKGSARQGGPADRGAAVLADEASSTDSLVAGRATNAHVRQPQGAAAPKLGPRGDTVEAHDVVSPWPSSSNISLASQPAWSSGYLRPRGSARSVATAAGGGGGPMTASSTDSLVAGQPWHLAGLPYAQAAAPSLRPAGMEGVLDVSPWPSSSQLGAPRGSPSASRASLAEAARVANAGAGLALESGSTSGTEVMQASSTDSLISGTALGDVRKRQPPPIVHPLLRNRREGLRDSTRPGTAGAARPRTSQSSIATMSPWPSSSNVAACSPLVQGSGPALAAPRHHDQVSPQPAHEAAHEAANPDTAASTLPRRAEVASPRVRFDGVMAEPTAVSGPQPREVSPTTPQNEVAAGEARTHPGGDIEQSPADNAVSAWIANLVELLTSELTGTLKEAAAALEKSLKTSEGRKALLAHAQGVARLMACLSNADKDEEERKQVIRGACRALAALSMDSPGRRGIIHYSDGFLQRMSQLLCCNDLETAQCCMRPPPAVCPALPARIRHRFHFAQLP